MKYILYLPIQILCMILCYLTNWLVVLFANEVGELPGFLRYWQTWDSTLDNQEYVEQNCFKFCRYKYSDYYREEMIHLDEYNRDKRVAIKLKDFHGIDRIKRYICRTCWIYRNCAYGFAFYWFGLNTCGNEIKLVYKYDVGDDERSHIGYEKGHSLWTTPWTIYYNRRVCSWLRWKAYLGWKINTEPDNRRNIIGTRISFKFGKGN